MLWVKTLPCSCIGWSRCSGVVEADHAGKRGLGQKCDDRETIPMCSQHHHDRHAFSGLFRSHDAARMRKFLDYQISRTRALFLRQFPTVQEWERWQTLNLEN